MADDVAQLGKKTGILMPRWIHVGVLLALLGLGFTFYTTVMSDSAPRQTVAGGLSIWAVLLPSMALGFGLPRYGKRVGVTLHTHGLSLWAGGKRRAIAGKEIDAFRWIDSQSVVVLDSGAEIPLPAWMASNPVARQTVEHFANRPPSSPAEA